MGGKNKAPAAQTTTSTPWQPQGQALQFGFNEARNVYDQGFTPFQSELSQGTIQQAGQALPQATNELSATAGGDYLGQANPYLQGVVDRSNRNVMSGMNSTFGGAGRTGSGIHQQSLGTALGDVATGVYAPAYEAERSRQLGAAQAIPSAISSQLGIGQGIEQAQGLSDYDNLQRYMGLVGSGNFGGTATGPQQEGRSPLSGALGGAMSGASLASAIPGLGTGVGALVGGGAGLLGLI